MATDFHDYVSINLPSKPVLVDEIDEVAVRLGLAWRVPHKPDSAVIKGVESCTRFLNEIVDEVWSDIKKSLGHHSKSRMLNYLMHNIESIRKENLKWKRTTRANMALQGNVVETAQVFTEQIANRNLAVICSRILMEMSLCECVAEENDSISKLEVSDLLSRVSVMYQIGGWSDGIAEGVITPEVKVLVDGNIYVAFWV